jgi:hypothetical protein
MVDSAFEPRGGGLVESHVRLLMESDPNDWPEILVSPDGSGRYVVIDGFHRYEAASRLGTPLLRCRVVVGAGYPDAVAANVSHGLPLSMADRKDAARWYAAQYPNLSYREIGRRVGLSDKTVKSAIETSNTSEPKGRDTPGPSERWLHQTYKLDAPPSVRDIRAEINAYNEDDRSDVARFYARVGRALVEASSPYVEGR